MYPVSLLTPTLSRLAGIRGQFPLADFSRTSLQTSSAGSADVYLPPARILQAATLLASTGCQGGAPAWILGGALAVGVAARHLRFRHLPPIQPGIREGIVNSGPLGLFYRHRRHGVSVYYPFGPERPSQNGNVLLIAGANTNHTGFGTLPKELAERGIGVQIFVFPGYDDLSSSEALSGGLTKAWSLASQWEVMMTRALVEAANETAKAYPDAPLYLGGYSLGAAALLLAFPFLDPTGNVWRALRGLILAAPALTYKAFEEGPRWVRHGGMPLGTLAHLHRRRRPPTLDPEIAAQVAYLGHRPMASEHAAVLLSERVPKVYERLSREWIEGYARSRAATGRMTPLEPGRFTHVTRALPLLWGRSGPLPILLLHGGRTDATVAESSVTLVREMLGRDRVREHEFSIGHWLFAAEGRRFVNDRVLEFVTPVS